METLYQTADAEDTLSDSEGRRYSIRKGFRRHAIIQRMQDSLYIRHLMQETIYDSGYRRNFIKQRMQASLYIRQKMQEPLYQTADAGEK